MVLETCESESRLLAQQRAEGKTVIIFFSGFHELFLRILFLLRGHRPGQVKFASEGSSIDSSRTPQ